MMHTHAQQVMEADLEDQRAKAAALGIPNVLTRQCSNDVALMGEAAAFGMPSLLMREASDETFSAVRQVCPHPKT